MVPGPGLKRGPLQGTLRNAEKSLKSIWLFNLPFLFLDFGLDSMSASFAFLGVKGVVQGGLGES
jgi:hypothetical protein